MANEIKTKIVLTGEAAFKRAMSDATREVQTLESELTLAKAEFKATGDKEKYAATQANILKAQITAQKKAVEQAEAAIQQLTKQGVEPQSRAMQTWRSKLNNAKTSLVNMQTRLDQVESEMSDLNGMKTDDVEREITELGNAADTTGTNVANISTKFDRKTLIEGINATTTAMENLMKGAARAGQAIFEAGSDAASWADGIRDSATAAHMSTDEYQRMRYAAQFFGTTVEQVAGQQAKITKAMAGGEALTVGSRSIETAGRRWTDVMWDVLEGLGEIPDEAERDAAAMEVFGKGYRELNGLIEGGREAWEQRYNEAPVVSENSINSLADAADAIKDMDARLETLKMETLTALAPGIETIATAVGDLAKMLTNFLQSEKGQELITKLADSIASIVTSFTEEDFTGIIEAITKVVDGLVGALSWISENKDGVVAAIQAIAGTFLTLKLASLGLKGADFVSSLKNLLGVGGGAAAAGGGATKAGLLSKFAGLGTGGELGAILGPLALVGGVWAGTNLVHENDAGNIHQRAEQIRADAEIIGESSAEMADALNLAADALDITDRKAFDGSTVLSDPAAVTRTLQQFQQYEWLRDILDPETWRQLQAIGTDASTLDMGGEADLLQRITDVMRSGAGPTPEAALRGLAGKGAHGSGDIDDLLDIRDWFTQADDLGLNEEGAAAIQGFVAGMKSAEPEALAEAAALAQGIKDTVARILDIHSPSRVMAQLGLYTGEGFAQGIEDSAAQVQRAVSGMLAIPARGKVGVGMGGGFGGGSSYSSSFYIDKYYQNTADDARALAQRVQDANGWRRNGFGHRA